MSIEIREYHEDYIPLQVELGKRLIDDWKYQSQSTEEHLRRVYGQENFKSKYRIYAFQGDDLVGFQTSNLIEEENLKIGRMEFPITDNEIVSDLLQEVSEMRLRDDGATKLRARTSPHWGKTEYFAEKYGFTFEKHHLMNAVESLKDMEVPDLTSDYRVVSVDPNGETADYFRMIFPKRFPMRYEGEVDEWMKYYADQKPVLWFILLDLNLNPVGHLIGFDREGTLAMTSFFSLGENPATKLQILLMEAIRTGKQNDELIQISLTLGDNQIPFADAIRAVGIGIEPQISYHHKLF